MTNKEVHDRLYALGYLRTRREALGPAVRRFQSDQGLKPDGIVGPQTKRALSDPLLGFCAVREHITTHEGLCKWPHPQITWHIAGSLKPRISDGDFQDAFAEAFGYWAAVCGIEPQYSPNAKTANVLVGAGRIDGASGTLAWSGLPCGNARQLEQQYDSGETFVIAETPARAQIDLVRVAAHEIGHVIGIPHLPSGSGALMAPMYSPAIRRPQRGDIEQAVKRYGPPKKPAETPAAPARPADDSGWIDLGFVKLRSPSRGGGDLEVKL